MIRALRYWLIRRRFSRMVATFDRQIEAARKAHKPVRHLMQAKQAYVHGCLAGVVA